MSTIAVLLMSSCLYLFLPDGRFPQPPRDQTLGSATQWQEAAAREDEIGSSDIGLNSFNVCEFDMPNLLCKSITHPNSVIECLAIPARQRGARAFADFDGTRKQHDFPKNEFVTWANNLVAGRSAKLTDAAQIPFALGRAMKKQNAFPEPRRFLDYATMKIKSQFFCF